MESYTIPASSAATVLDNSIGNHGTGMNLRILKIFSSDLGRTTPGVSGANATVVNSYRVIERIVVLAKDRRSGEVAVAT